MQGAGEQAADTGKTKRGDRAGRRRDILQAASDLLRSKGYAELNMREIAARAGVSAGTPYSYFANKEAIFATLLIQRFEALRETLDELDVGGTARVEDLIVALLPDVEEIQNHFGQYVPVWEQASDDMAAVTIELGQAFLELLAVFERVVRATAEREGRLLDQGKLSTPFLWASIAGLATYEVEGFYRIQDYDPDELRIFAARALVAGLTVEEKGRNA